MFQIRYELYFCFFYYGAGKYRMICGFARHNLWIISSWLKPWKSKQHITHQIDRINNNSRPMNRFSNYYTIVGFFLYVYFSIDSTTVDFTILVTPVECPYRQYLVKILMTSSTVDDIPSQIKQKLYRYLSSFWNKCNKKYAIIMMNNFRF